MAKGNTKTKPPVDDDEDIELEDLDADVEEDEAPAKSKAQEVEFGASDLAKYLTEKLDNGKTISPRDLRALIRKMAREETPRVDREITAGNRTRYNWPGGLKNPEVKAIVKAVLGGEMEADKQAKLAELKAKKAAKTAEGGGKAGKKGKKGKAAAAPEPDDDVEEIEIDDDE